MATLGVEECAKLMRVERTTVLHLASTGELPGAKIGKQWVFIEEDIMQYLRMKIEQQVAERRAMVEDGFETPRLASVIGSVKKRGRPRAINVSP